MTLARVVTFEEVEQDRVDQLKATIDRNERPEELPATEVFVLHDPDGRRLLTILFFENEDDYRTGDELMNSAANDATPGRRTSVQKYEVATRRTGG